MVVTYHPVTLEKNTAKEQFENLLAALDEIKGYKIIFTKANADTDGRIVNRLIEEYVKVNSERAVCYTSLGIVRYLSTLKYSEMVIGNSSSGLLEAPSFHIPTVNIGDRQKGRVRAESVIDCGYELAEIIKAIKQAIQVKSEGRIEGISNPYEGENTSLEIYKKILEYINGAIENKEFYDL